MKDDKLINSWEIIKKELTKGHTKNEDKEVGKAAARNNLINSLIYYS